MVKVFGHRGERQNPKADENSDAAFKTALDNVDGLETDAIVSAQDTVFLGHDVTQRYIPRTVSKSVYVFRDLLDKASAGLVGERHIEDLSDEEIGRLKLKKGGKVGQLSALFDEAAKHPGKIINIEVKGETAIGPVIAEIKQAIAAGKITEEQIVLSSFNHPAMKKAKELAPNIKRGLIFAGSSRYDSRIYPWSGNEESRYVEFNKKALEAKLTKEINPDFFVMKSDAVTPQNVSLLRQHFANAKVMFWTNNEKPPEQNTEVLKILTDPRTKDAVEAVITDYPVQMDKVLKAKGLRN